MRLRTLEFKVPEELLWQLAAPALGFIAVGAVAGEQEEEEQEVTEGEWRERMRMRQGGGRC